MTGKYIRGALVEFKPTFLIPLPNVIVFQYNPETMTHNWTPSETVPPANEEANPLIVRNVPGQSFSFTLMLDASDDIIDGNPVSSKVAEVSGVYARLAALELLLFPVPADASNLVGSVSVSVGAGGVSVGASGGGGTPTAVPQSQVPTVLFVYGPGRILPVRVTSLVTTEKLYDDKLNPIRVEVQMTLKVLTPNELKFVTGPLRELAQGAFDYSQKLREVLAIANLANTADSIVGLLPF